MVSYWGQVEGSREPKAPVQLQYAMPGCVFRQEPRNGRTRSAQNAEWDETAAHTWSARLTATKRQIKVQPRPTTHCVPDLQFQFIEMQEFHVFSEQFFCAGLARSRSVNADHEWHKILTQPEPSLFRAAPLCSKVERLLIPTLVGYTIPKTCHNPKTHLAVLTRNLFLLLVQRDG